MRKIGRHHIRPRSRGGTDDEENIVFIDIRRHETYHKLFDNKTPEEIIEYLVKYFWGGQWEWVVRALHKAWKEEQ